uniref:VPS13 domain-containing protein n=1 Tax=Macrostomum lignano TaxID=282301 RepID=A0A1I8F8B9_9PLAT
LWSHYWTAAIAQLRCQSQGRRDRGLSVTPNSTSEIHSEKVLNEARWRIDVADTTLCLILNLYRRTYWLANALREGKKVPPDPSSFAKWPTPCPRRFVATDPLGLVGFGRMWHRSGSEGSDEQAVAKSLKRRANAEPPPLTYSNPSHSRWLIRR